MGNLIINISSKMPPFNDFIKNEVRKSRNFTLSNSISDIRPENVTPGIYFIWKKDELLYIGHSKTNVIRAMYRHFYTWNNKQQTRVTYTGDISGIYVNLIPLNSADIAVQMEKALIMALKPKDNEDKFRNLMDQIIEDPEANMPFDNDEI